MEGKIIFLGTGGDSISVGKQTRTSGGIILQTGENQFHIDPGPGSLVMADYCGVNLRENTAIFVSHAHINHCNDVNAVIEAMTLKGLDKRGVLVCNKTLYEGFENAHPYLTKFHESLLEKVLPLDKDQKIGINEVDIRTVGVKHSDQKTVGFKFITPTFTLGYTSDTGYSDDLTEPFKDTDIMVVNVKYPNGMRNEFHLCTDDATKLIGSIKPRLAIITHFGIKMVEADVLNEAREIQKRSGVETIVADDGMVIYPLSYASSLRKKPDSA